MICERLERVNLVLVICGVSDEKTAHLFGHLCDALLWLRKDGALHTSLKPISGEYLGICRSGGDPPGLSVWPFDQLLKQKAEGEFPPVMDALGP